MSDICCESLEKAISKRHMACTKSYGNMINYNITPDYNCRSNNTPLHIATINGNYEKIEFLLECGADPRLSYTNSKLGLIPIHHAIGSNFIECVRAFLRYDPTLINVLLKNKESLLHYTLRRFIYMEEIIKLLFDYGIDYNLKDERGYLAINYTLNKNYHNLIKKLIEEREDMIKEPQCD